jgi:hypothetical protein
MIGGTYDSILLAFVVLFLIGFPVLTFIGLCI